MSMTQEPDVLKSETLQQQFAQLQDYVRRSAKEGRAIHEVEEDLWTRLLHRPVDAGGLSYWSDVFALGASRTDVAWEIFNAGPLPGLPANEDHMALIERAREKALARCASEGFAAPSLARRANLFCRQFTTTH